WLFLVGAAMCLALAGCGPATKYQNPASVFRTPRRPMPPPAGEEHDEPGEAARFFFERRSPDGITFPSERYVEAAARIRSMPLYSTVGHRFVSPAAGKGVREASIGNWIPLGPGNVGGRTRALLIHPTNPNTMYAGSVAGGVWKSTDGGATWNPLND